MKPCLQFFGLVVVLSASTSLNAQQVNESVTKKSPYLLEAGTHQLSFDASGLSSGVYIYRLQTPQISVSQQMMLMK